MHDYIRKNVCLLQNNIDIQWFVCRSILQTLVVETFFQRFLLDEFGKGIASLKTGGRHGIYSCCIGTVVLPLLTIIKKWQGAC